MYNDYIEDSRFDPKVINFFFYEMMALTKLMKYQLYTTGS